MDLTSGDPVTAGVRITVEPDRCAGSGMCRSIAPTIFGADDHGWVTLLVDDPGDDINEALDAADACPLGVIAVVDADGQSLA